MGALANLVWKERKKKEKEKHVRGDKKSMKSAERDKAREIRVYTPLVVLAMLFSSLK